MSARAKRSHHAPPAAAARATRYGLSARDRQRLVYALSALGDCRVAVLNAMREIQKERRAFAMSEENLSRMARIADEVDAAQEVVMAALGRIAGDG